MRSNKVLRCIMVSFMILICAESKSIAQEKIYMYATDELGNQIESPADDNRFPVYQMRYNIHRPYDPETMEITGQRIFGSLNIFKRLDESSPFFYEYLCNAKRLTTVQIDIYHIDGDTGEEVKYFEIFLEDVTLVSMKTIQCDTKLLENEDKLQVEHMKMIADKIKWTYVDGDIFYEESPYDGYGRIIPKTAAIKGIMRLWDYEGNEIEGGELAEGGMRFFEYGSHVNISYDESTGKQNGPRILGIPEVMKNINKATPILIEHLSKDRTLEKVEFHYYTIDESTGEDKEFYVITLEEVKIVSDSLDFSTWKENYDTQEYLSFKAKKWTWDDLENHNTYSEDDYASYIASKLEKSENLFNIYNFPNPFNQTTNIFFSVPEMYKNEKINISIYDINGRLIKNIYNDVAKSENNIISWNATNKYNLPLNSGTYFYNVAVGGKSETGKLQLLK